MTGVGIDPNRFDDYKTELIKSGFILNEVGTRDIAVLFRLNQRYYRVGNISWYEAFWKRPSSRVITYDTHTITQKINPEIRSHFNRALEIARGYSDGFEG
jgi:hypothetical protein